MPPTTSVTDRTVPVAWILAVLLRERRTLLLGTGAGVLIALVIALLTPRYYSATFSFLPQSSQDQARGGLASLAGQFGIPIGLMGGQSQPPQLYAELIETRAVLGPVAKVNVSDGNRSMTVAEYLEVRGSDTAEVRERTVQALREKVVFTSVSARTTGAVNVRVRTKSPRISYAIAQQLLEGLNEFNRVTRQSQAGEERRFTQHRLEAARVTLRAAEDQLQGFLQRNRNFSSPQLTFEEDRLRREVSLQQRVVEGLAQQFEDARIREVRDTPVITLVEHPTMPAIADPRGRVRLMILGTFGALALAVLFVLGREGWRRRRVEDADPAYAELEGEWRRLRERLKIS